MRSPDREERLLLAAVGPPASVDAETVCALLAGDPLDARYLYAASVAHSMVPLVNRLLSDLGTREALRNLAAAPFARHVQVGSLRSSFLERCLDEVLGALEREGVRTLVWKGPALARQAYGDLALRGFGDLDLYCAPEDVSPAVAALEQLGYVGVPHLEPWRLERALALDCQYPLERAAGEVRVELHWGVVRPPFGDRPDFDRLWARRASVPADGFEIPAPGAPDHLLLLAVHGYKHAWSRLAWLADLAWLQGVESEREGNPEGDLWAETASAARRRDFTVEVELARELLRRVLDADSPPDSRSLPARVARLADRVERSRFPPVGEPGPLGRLGFHLAGRSSWMARIRSALAIALLPALDDLAAPRLPRELFPFYYLLRPLLLLLKRGRSQENH